VAEAVVDPLIAVGVVEQAVVAHLEVGNLREFLK
jgi:hypothetical protein